MQLNITTADFADKMEWPYEDVAVIAVIADAAASAAVTAVVATDSAADIAAEISI